MSALFNTITTQDWRDMFARHRAEGQREGSVMLAQIRAALRKESPAPFNPISEPTEGKTEGQRGRRGPCENSASFVLGK